jgi:hypothetical protein
MSWFLLRKPFYVVEETMYEKPVANKNCLDLKKSLLFCPICEDQGNVMPSQAHGFKIYGLGIAPNVALQP